MSDARSALRKQVVDLINAESDLNSVLVEYGWPGELGDQEMIFPGRIRGTLEVPVFHGQPSASNPLTYDDRFTMELFWRAGVAAQTFLEAEQRGGAIRAVIHRVMRTHALTDSVDGTWSLSDAVMTEDEGDTGPTKEGFEFWGRIVLEFRVRISGGTP